MSGFSHRRATRDDLAALRELMARSIDALLGPMVVDAAELAASREFMGLDSQLIDDRTYFVIEEGVAIVGCGGWSRRATLFGGDHSAGRDAALVDPAREPARLRAMYTAPEHARRGVGRRIIDLCEADARAEGFTAIELAATRAGVPLYERAGFEVVERFERVGSNGAIVPLARMRRAI